MKTAMLHRRVMRLVMWLRRWWARVTQPGTGGLIQPGDWRVLYQDGKRSHYMSYGDARNYSDRFCGELEWRHDT